MNSLACVTSPKIFGSNIASLELPEPLKMIPRLIGQMEELEGEMLGLEQSGLASSVAPIHRASARNLLHYVALRRHDVRDLQRDLAALGLSSLGRTESHVLETVRAVLAALRCFEGRSAPPVPAAHGRRELEANTEALLGPARAGRRVRIMVTMPPEAAVNAALVRNLVTSGMDVMRINTAHDGPAAWSRMITHLRAAEAATGQRCRVEMDLAGPKLRTGPLRPGPAVVKYRPRRDAYGRLEAPARVWLTAAANPLPPPAPAAAVLPVPGAWLSALEPGVEITFRDARGSRRALVVKSVDSAGAWAESAETAYVVPGTRLAAPDGAAEVGEFAARPEPLLLRVGDELVLTRALEPGQPASGGEPARIGVTLPALFEHARVAEPVWFDDGLLGGLLEEVTPQHARVRITQAPPEGGRLSAEKGINLPKTDLRIPALTEEDEAALPFVAREADMAGLSFVRRPEDVADLRGRLKALGREDLGVLLKIETEQAFTRLPDLLLEAMRGRAAGVMIARGDLAVECGWQRLAEIQEEILWLAEAAQAPVVWATQVLETLSKTGRPSRSEITDAAMGERAECVMLNKGPFVREAVRLLDDILRRMEAHQEKKTAMLRRLSVAVAFEAVEAR